MRSKPFVMLGIGLVVILAVADAAAQREPVMRPQRSWPQLQDEGMARPRLERIVPPSAAGAATTAAKTVLVDCAKGGSISAALAKNTGPLVIEVRGICRENVRIERDDLTIRGANPASDGIRGVTADPQTAAALELYYANRTRLENFSVSDSPGAGVGAWWSQLVMLNCRIERNGYTGIIISATSALTGKELVVSSNWRGISCQRGGWVQCTGCTLEGNANWAATSLLGGDMTLLDTVVSGGRGIWARDAGSYVDVDCGSVVSSYPCSIHVSGDAASAGSGGIAYLYVVGQFTGRVQAANGGRVYVYEGQQNPGTYLPNNIWNSGWLETGIALSGGSATTLGRTILWNFAHAILENATQLLDTLECETGSDAWSDTPYPKAQVLNCVNVPTIP